MDSTKKHLYPLELRVRPNNTARYTDALPFYYGFIGLTRTIHSTKKINGEIFIGAEPAALHQPSHIKIDL